MLMKIKNKKNKVGGITIRLWCQLQVVIKATKNLTMF
jgi:hypothetical protein